RSPRTMEEAAMATTTDRVDALELEARVKEMYRDVAEHPDKQFHFETGRELAIRLGYQAEEVDLIPGEAVDSFAGVGYYFDLAALRPAETVVDLGSGSGMDSFVAARYVGRSGRVIGIDMTEAQLAKSRRLARGASLDNVEFRQGHIEHLDLDGACA